MQITKAKTLLARILRMELTAVCRSFFDGEEGAACSLPYITDAQIALIDEAAECLTDEQYVMLHRIFWQLKEQKQLPGEEKRESCHKMVYRYMNAVYLEYYKQMCVPEDYFLLMDEQIINIYNALMPTGQRLAAGREICDKDGKPIYTKRGKRIVAYDAAGEKICDTKTDAEGNISGWKKTGNYSGGFCEGAKNGKGIEYYDTAGCYGVRREGIWRADVFVEGTEYGVLIYKGEDYEIKRDFEGNVLHKDLDYVWDVIMGDGESARYYFADVELKEGEYVIVKDSIRPAIA